MKISIITVTYNAEEFLEQCIRSVISQTYADIEYIIIDGGSTDSTLSIVDKYKKHVNILISEPDKGIYDAMNKGIDLSCGNVVGMLNADDFFADDQVIEAIADSFNKSSIGIVYGNLWYVDRNYPDLIVRKWISKSFSYRSMSWGWMPAHPTFYSRRKLFIEHGKYNLKLKTCADYELMLRFMYLNKINSVWLDKILVKMRTGGISNRSFKNRISAGINDFKAMKHNHIKYPWLKVIIKPLRKVKQYLFM